MVFGSSGLSASERTLRLASPAFLPCQVRPPSMLLKTPWRPATYSVPGHDGSSASALIIWSGRSCPVRVQDRAPSSDDRSEEHTSELQSLAYLVCRLLLEKKKERSRDSPLDSS